MTTKKNIITTLLVFVLAITALVPVMGCDDVYADSGSSKKRVKSLKKSIKTYNAKTQKIAKQTPKAKKPAKKTKKYYKKSKKTKKIRTLKKYRNKAKMAYRSALVFDYQRKINDINKDIKTLSNLAPSMEGFVSDGASINNKAKKCNVISTLKHYLSKIKTVQKKAKSHKETLSWHEAEYRYDWIDGHMEKVILQPAEYKYMIVGYYVQLAELKGYNTGGTYGWNLEKCKANGAVFPYSENDADMKEWGCQYYSQDNGQTFHDIILPSELSAFAKYLNSIGLGSQSRETGEWFLIQEEISEEKWIEGYYKKVLIKKAGWY